MNAAVQAIPQARSGMFDPLGALLSAAAKQPREPK
jgi:hypothetical protein